VLFGDFVVFVVQTIRLRQWRQSIVIARVKKSQHIITSVLLLAVSVLSTHCLRRFSSRNDLAMTSVERYRNYTRLTACRLSVVYSLLTTATVPEMT